MKNRPAHSASCIVAFTGASGAAYGIRLVEALLSMGIETSVIVSQAGALLLREEAGLDLAGADPGAKLKAFFKKRGAQGRLKWFSNNDLAAPLASGSALKKTMVVCPCSMGTLARIASGVSGNLIERAADCVIKERGQLILVPRETPLSAIHLENMLKLARIGVVILPAMPAFYTHPKSVEEMVDFIAGKTLDSLGIENSLYKRWKTP
ncbi:MAG: UbiX family flavin prenyltransferase [Deltaproteobacteria bacterium]|nr:UbiX family flavin prenyltransferase [Deltaproteobacteria bacterium]